MPNDQLLIALIIMFCLILLTICCTAFLIELKRLQTINLDYQKAIYKQQVLMTRELMEIAVHTHNTTVFSRILAHKLDPIEYRKAVEKLSKEVNRNNPISKINLTKTFE